MKQGASEHVRSGSGEPDDGALLQRIAEGDEASFATLYDRYSGIVYGIALRVLKDSAGAEDVLQEVFLQIWRNPAAYNRSRGAIAPWLAVIARNRALDRIRKLRAETELDETAEVVDDSFYQEAERAVLMQEIHDVLRDIPAEQRNALEMAFFDGMTHAEIAEKTGTPLGTVKGRLRAAVNSIIGALRK